MPKKSQNSFATNLVKYGLITAGSLLTIFAITSSQNIFSGLIIVSVCWIIGIFFWYRRKAIHAWSESQVPLKEYISTKNHENSSAYQMNSSLDNKNFNHFPLTSAENERWDDIIDNYYDDSVYDAVRKPKDKKKKTKD